MGNVRILKKSERKIRLQVYIKQKYIIIIEKLATESNESKSKILSDIIEQYLENKE